MQRNFTVGEKRLNIWGGVNWVAKYEHICSKCGVDSTVTRTSDVHIPLHNSLSSYSSWDSWFISRTGKLASFNCSWHSNKGTFHALGPGKAGIERMPSESEWLDPAFALANSLRERPCHGQIILLNESLPQALLQHCGIAALLSRDYSQVSPAIDGFGDPYSIAHWQRKCTDLL